MALSRQHSSFPILSFFALMILLSFVQRCTCFNFKTFNFSVSDGNANWGPASATWYGASEGAGPDDNGGGCGYKNVNLPPFNSLTACGNPTIFKGGKGCGACYLVKCSSHPSCSGNPSTITVTDSCLDGVCLDAPVHFDMSGTSFGSMAFPGRANDLRSAGRLPIQFARVPCSYPGLNIAFHVEAGANPFYMPILIEYQDGDGDLSAVDLMEGTRSNTWIPMHESWGVVWRLDADHPLQGPFSIRLTTGTSGKTLVATNVIPADWQQDTTYRSVAQFSS